MLDKGQAILAIAESSTASIMLLDTDARILFINRTAPGLTVQAVLGTQVYQYVSPDQHPAMRQCFAQVMQSGAPGSYENVYRTADGSPLYWESRVSAVRGVDNSTTGFAVIATDVTDRRAIEVERERMFALSFDLICVASQDGYFRRVSDSFAQTLGYSLSEFLRSPFEELIHPDDRKATRGALRQLADGHDVMDFENRYRHRNGSYRLLSWRAMKDPSTGYLYYAARDVTELRERERRLQQDQKMEAVGRLAGGIAHDFNNLLQVIIGNTELAYTHPEIGETLRHRLDAIASASSRAQTLVAQLLPLGKPQPERVIPVDLCLLGRSVASLMTSLLREDISIELELSDKPVFVDADRSQLEQVLMNLFVNARDALSQGGSIILRVKRSAPWAHDEKTGLESRSCIEVEDTGPGIAADIRERIFEPYFSTKGQGGSGLGLSTAYAIVTKLSGTIEVREGARGGALFHIELPASSNRPQAEPSERVADRQAGHGALLVAEDQEAVRRTVVASLSAAGYRVFEAADGLEALQVMERHGADIRAAVLDVVMPNLGGPEAWARIRERWPHMRVVFMTGYADSPTLDALVAKGAIVLRKPHKGAELLSALEDALGAEPRTRA